MAMLERGTMVFNPYHGILLERVEFHGVVFWLVFWSYMDEEADMVLGDGLVTQSGTQDHAAWVDEVKRACSVSFQWVEEEKIKLWV